MIRTEPRARCFVCGSEGVLVHDAIPDLMLETPGRWRIVRCRSADCGLLWLDPRPVPEELGKLYQDYFTHETEGVSDRGSSLKEQVRRVIQQRLLGYPAEAGTPVRALALGVSLVPWLRAAALRELFWLPARDIGRLLDIGCGNGQPMRRFVEAGWTATGIDADAEAVAAARSTGLDARAGALKSQGFPDAYFDVVLMSHVIEHLPDPIDELKECRRILKPSGSIVIATPNSLALGHRVFGRHWLGLDPPRHLQIFTPKALTRVLAMAGFVPKDVRTHAGVAPSWMVASQWRRDAEAMSRIARLPTRASHVPIRWRALARLQAIGVALGAAWGDELIGRYVPHSSLVDRI